MYKAITFLALTAVLAGPAAAQDKAAIEKLNNAFETAFNKGDTAAVANMYVEDAYLLPPGSPMVQGGAKVQSFWTEAAKTVGDLKLTTLDVKPLGNNAAREVGRWSLKTKGQQAQEMNGKYVVIWEKSGSDWKLATDIWNADK